MKIVILSENTSSRDDVLSEHGLSLYIETENHKFIFDTGHSANFADNAKKLAVDINEAEFAVISHGHHDHGGGLAKFIETNTHAPIYLSKYAFEPHFHEPTKYIGLDENFQKNKRFIKVEKEVKINEQITLCVLDNDKLVEPIKPYGLHTKQDDKFIDEDFRHEIYLQIIENGKKVLLSGCSHRGIINIVDYFKPDILIGGFHFMELSAKNLSDRNELDRNIKKLQSYKTKYYTCHCTGLENFEYMKQKMGDLLEYVSGGMQIII